MSTTSEESGKPAFNVAAVLRYPFRDMSMGWWDEYLHTVSSSDRVTIILRVMDCLMAHALLHEDPFLEEAVMIMSKKIPKTLPRNLSQDLINSFEVAHHLFKTICVTAKFPSLDAGSKRGLLTMTEGRIQEIDKAARQPEVKMSSNVSAAAFVAMDRVRMLRKNLDSRVGYIDTMDALKTLFFTISVRNGVVPKFTAGTNPYDTFVCCDGCPCYGKLRTGHTIFLRDVEKAKIIDCLMICAVKENDAFMHDITSELLSNHYKDYMENPYLDDIGKHIQNGKIFYCRTALFDALNLIHYLTQLHNDPTQVAKDGACSMDRIVLSVAWVKNEVREVRVLNELVPLLDRTLVTAESAYNRLGQVDCLQDLRTLKDYATAAFTALSASEYHLAVHSRDVFVGKPADMKCANAACPATTKDLLKCSGCDVTYYCSPECQKVDWERHKNFCHEIESRRTKPPVIPCVVGPTKRITVVV